MKISYLIKTHKYPEHLCKLISRLNWEDVDFYIHVDQKSDIAPFRKAISQLALKNIYWVKRTKVHWGEYGSVQATINAIRQILSSDKDYDFICELSGQDYPIKNNRSIFDFFGEYLNFNFIRFSPLPIRETEWNWGRAGGMDRINRYYIRMLGKPRVFPQQYESASFQNKLLNKILSLRFNLPRSFPKDLQPFGGEAWFCLTTEAARYIIKFLESRPDVVDFFRYGWNPDEMIFQTIICNANTFDRKLVNDHLHYISWKNLSPHPGILTINDRENLLFSKKLFARKFDPDNDPGIIDWIDQKILGFQ